MILFMICFLAQYRLKQSNVLRMENQCLLFSKQKNVMTEPKEKKPKVDIYDISDSPRTKIKQTRQAPLKKRPTGTSEN